MQVIETNPCKFHKIGFQLRFARVFTPLVMAFSLKFHPLALGIASLLSLIFSISSGSLFPKTSRFTSSPDRSTADQATSSPDVPSDQTVPTQISGMDIQSMHRDSLLWRALIQRFHTACQGYFRFGNRFPVWVRIFIDV